MKEGGASDGSFYGLVRREEGENAQFRSFAIKRIDRARDWTRRDVDFSISSHRTFLNHRLSSDDKTLRRERVGRKGGIVPAIG